MTKLLSQSDFGLKSKTDQTSNKQNITYTLQQALNLSEYNATATWDMKIQMVCDTSSEGDKLEDYVDFHLDDDIVNKYDGYLGLLNIVDVDCNITEKANDLVWIIVGSSIGGCCCCLLLCFVVYRMCKKKDGNDESGVGMAEYQQFDVHQPTPNEV